MSVDGAGNFTRLYSWATDAAGGIKIQSGRMDDEFDNYAAACNLTFWRDGRTPMTGNFKLGGNSITGAGLGSASACSYSFTGSNGQNTGIYSPSAGVASIAASGTEILRATSTGVGIGNSGVAPDSLFMVQNAANLGAFRIAYNGTSVNYMDGDTQYFRGGDGSLVNLTIHNTGDGTFRGNVGGVNGVFSGTVAGSNIGTAAAFAAGANSAGQLLVLDGSGLIPTANLPALTVNKTFVNASQAAMLANAANIGDIAVRTDVNESFILQVAGAGTLSNWIQLLSPTAAVSSVAGRTGAVVLTNADIGGLGSLALLNSLTSANIISYLGYTPMNLANYGNVENKSSATIRGELTSGNVTTALTFTPMNAASYGNVENKSSATIRGELTAANVNTALGKTAARVNTGTGASSGLISVGTAAPSGTPDDGQIYLQYV